MMLENKEAVIFDLDGTITDSMWVWADIDRTFFEQRKIPMPPTLNKEIEGMSFTETAEYFIRTFQLPETVEELKDIWNRIALDKYAHETPLKPGAGEILKYLKEHHIKTGIATSNSRLLLDVFLKERDLEPYIDKNIPIFISRYFLVKATDMPVCTIITATLLFSPVWKCCNFST